MGKDKDRYKDKREDLVETKNKAEAERVQEAKKENLGRSIWVSIRVSRKEGHGRKLKQE
jgi:hypothetical protein